MRVRGVAPDLGYVRVGMANVYLYGPRNARDRGWTLIDAGMPGPGSSARISKAAAEWFGPDVRPQGIVLTHGHFDHVGALGDLAERWGAPIYAHSLEIPHLTGRSAYPLPDPFVGGGLLAVLSRLYPRGPFDFDDRVRPLPEDGSVPGMPGWRWIHTPGHTAGHVSLFRDEDRSLIAGDAFVTAKQESALAALAWRPKVHRPPAYFTPDWAAARGSVQRLAALEPELAATGHGPPMRGPDMRRQLHMLARDFDRLAVPRYGRYVGRRPAPGPVAKALVGVGVAALAGLALKRALRPARPTQWRANSLV
jgi:glyoxylase-like metal-dependent hydrolase (beta-lactamase superfamily II)